MMSSPTSIFDVSAFLSQRDIEDYSDMTTKEYIQEDKLYYRRVMKYKVDLDYYEGVIRRQEHIFSTSINDNVLHIVWTADLEVSIKIDNKQLIMKCVEGDKHLFDGFVNRLDKRLTYLDEDDWTEIESDSEE